VERIIISIALVFGSSGACLAAQASYQCKDGTAVKAVFSAPGPASSARLTLGGGQTITLPQVLSADGGRYADGGIEFWIKGKTARLTRGGAVTECKTR
jgi:membrane-bound inhibitor of C-type lysozyme